MSETVKLYVAGSITNKDNIGKIIEKFENLGYVITHNWTLGCEKGPKAAELDINGVKRANILVVIMDEKDYSYRGTYCEIGCALGLGIPIFLYNPEDSDDGFEKIGTINPKTCVFYWHKSIKRFSDLKTMLDCLLSFKPSLVDKNFAKNISQHAKPGQKTLSIISNLIEKNAKRGYKELRFKLKPNHRQDVKYITDELVKLDFKVIYEKDTVFIDWS